MPFDFIYGNDDYLTEQAARERWNEMTAGLDADFSVNIIDGRCQKVDEVETLVNNVRGAVQTVGLFGGTRAVWIKSVSFITDSVVGRAEGTTTALEDLKPLLEKNNPEETRILITATPIDKRLSFFKWLSSNTGTGKSKEISSFETLDAASLDEIAKKKFLKFEPQAAELFLQKVGASARALENELEKLSLYLGSNERKIAKVELQNVIDMTSVIAEAEFFEPMEAFYSRKADWALDSARRYFSTRKDADLRPILAAFFNRNRLLMMIRAYEAEGLCRIGARGVQWTPKADEYKARMGAEKTPFNLFVQNPWYLGKLSQEATRFTLLELKKIHADLFNLFEQSVQNRDQANALEAFFVRHLPVNAASV